MSKHPAEPTQKKILILKKNSQSLISVEKYLAKRGWHVTATHEMKIAVLKAVEVKPDFIFISFDHHNEKVINLPKVLSQFLKATIVPFLERQSSFALHNIKQSGFAYSLFPPLTGPKFERLIHKINYDIDHIIENPVEKRSAFQSQTTGNNEMVIKIKGSNQSFSATESNQLNFTELTTALDSQDNNEISIKQINTASGRHFSQEELEVLVSKESMLNLSQCCPDITMAAGENKDQYRQRLIEEIKRKNLLAQNQDAENTFFDEVYARATEMAEENSSQNEQVTFVFLQKALTELVSHCPDSLKKGNLENQESLNQRLLSQLVQHTKNEGQNTAVIESELNFEPKSALEISSFKTIDSIRTPGSTAVQKEEKKKSSYKVETARCYLIDSQHYYGYLVVTSERDYHNDKEFQQLVTTRLKEYLKDSGQEIDFSEVMNIRFQQVDFQDWSLDQADFLHQCISDGQEIAIAFFPGNQARLAMNAPNEKQMHAISIHEFMGGIPVEFNLYVYLKQNDRYLHYTKGGFILYQNQKERLEEKGILEMHVHSEELHELKKYRVQNYLNQLILEYKSKRGMTTNEAI
ncbi:MAG: hypothetical protein ACK5WZ_03600 [Pseudobdellovibrionaceae bacterium]